MTATATKIAAVRSWLATQHILVDEEWLTGCIEYLCDEGTEHTQLEINRLTREQWLLNDLKDVCPGSLPSNVASLDKTQLPGRYVLQVNCTMDIGTPAYQQYQKMKKVNIENIEETTRHEDKIPNHRMIKLFLTDGVQEIFGIEYRTMRNLTCDITPGCKLLLKGPIDCRRGVLLLQEHNIEILGGEVEDLVTANNLPAVLNRLLGVQDAGVRRDNPAQVAPPPQQSSANALRTLDPNTAHTDINRPTNFQNNPTRVANIRQGNISERNSFEKITTNNQPNTSSSRPVAVVTGIPVVDNFDDDIDLDQIAAIEEQVIKQGNKRPLWSDSVADRRNSAEKKLKMVPQMQNRVNEFPDDEDIFLEDDPFHDIFDAAASKPVVSYPINVSSEPFIYIKQIKDMSETEREGKVLRIKGQILKLLSKLSIGKEGWSLKCTLIDGTGCLDVEFTSQVLTKLVGYSPSEMNQIKKEIATKPEVKEKATAALNAAKTNLQVLNCIIEITFAGVPKITELIPFSEQHAKLLEDRVMSTKL